MRSRCFSLLLLLTLVIVGCTQVAQTNKPPSPRVIDPQRNDKQALAQGTLEWLLRDSNLPGQLGGQEWFDPKNVILSNRNIDDKYQFSIQGTTITILSHTEIERITRVRGEFYVLEFSTIDHPNSKPDTGFTINKNNAVVTLSINGTGSLMGQGEQIYFKRQGNNWVFDQAVGSWIE